MRADDLMIGDWVAIRMNHDSERHGYKEGDYIPHRVNSGLYPYNDGEMSMVTIDSNSYQLNEFAKPIPLTSEILKSNGFSYDPFSSGIWSWKSDDGEISCIMPKGENYWLFYVNDNIIPNHFYFVHQLQHTLRLCEIDKDIVL